MVRRVSTPQEFDQQQGLVIGSKIIDVVTAGMYSHPFAVIREYVQNAVDSIDIAYERHLLSPGEDRIDIYINGTNRSISITDNGAGIPKEEVEELLLRLGCSQKIQSKQRGFRGIGRLGGLGYCDQVVFETRADKTEPISILIWDGKKLKELMSQNGKGLSAEEAIAKTVSINIIKPRLGDPNRFFRVTMRNVHRFHRDELMIPKSVSISLGKVAPVEFNDDQFDFGPNIRQHVSGVPGYRTYNIFLNGETVSRPHTNKMVLHGQNIDEIKGVETFIIMGPESQEIGRGWYAVTKYLAALPPQEGMRGLRVRQGNIEIGDEYFLADLYKERRFSTWHIGEVHLDYSLKANARRDSFEQSPKYEMFLEQMHYLCRHLSGLCRDSSKYRSNKKIIENALERLEELNNIQIILDKNEMYQFLDQTYNRILIFEQSFGESDDVAYLKSRLEDISIRIGNGLCGKPAFSELIDGRCIQYPPKELLQEIAKSILEIYDGKMGKDRLLFEIFGKYMRKKSLNKLFQTRK